MNQRESRAGEANAPGRRISSSERILLVGLALLVVALAGLTVNRAAAHPEVETITRLALVPGTQTFRVGTGGSVTLQISSTELVVLAATPSRPDWEVGVEQASGSEVQVEFRRSEQRAKFDADIQESGTVLKTRVRLRGDAPAAPVGPPPAGPPPAAAADDQRFEDEQRVPIGQVPREQIFEVDPAGSVRVHITAVQITVVEVIPNGDWTFEVELASGREAEVNFSLGEQRAKFNAELQEGGTVLKTRVRLKDVTAEAMAQTDSAIPATGVALFVPALIRPAASGMVILVVTPGATIPAEGTLTIRLPDGFSLDGDTGPRLVFSNVRGLRLEAVDGSRVVLRFDRSGGHAAHSPMLLVLTHARPRGHLGNGARRQHPDCYR